jgi:hypothetical protein
VMYPSSIIDNYAEWIKHELSYTYSMPPVQKKWISVAATQYEHRLTLLVFKAHEQYVSSIKFKYEYTVKGYYVEFGVAANKWFDDREKEFDAAYDRLAKRWLTYSKRNNAPLPQQQKDEEARAEISNLRIIPRFQEFAQGFHKIIAARDEKLEDELYAELDKKVLQSFHGNTIQNLYSKALKNSTVYKEHQNKKHRVRAGIAAKVVPNVLVAGAMSAGIGIASHGATLARDLVKGTGHVAKNLPKLWGLLREIEDGVFREEENIYIKAEKDVKAVLAAFDKTKAANSSLAKHLTELNNLMAVRGLKIEGLIKQRQEAEQIARIPNASVDDKMTALKVIEIIDKKMPSLEESVQKGEKLFADLKKYNESLPAVLFIKESNTLLGNMGKFFNFVKDRKLKNVATIGSDLNSGAGGIADIGRLQ